MSDIRDYQVNHLLLLIGSNPVPNAVAGKLLVAPGGRITLIHSQESASLAIRLREWLLRNIPAEVLIGRKEVDESDADSVYRGVREALTVYKSNLSKATYMEKVRVGLNYTGGTKVMSVHAYRAVENWAKDPKNQSQNWEAVFSYLDARSLSMRIDPIAGRSILPFYVGRQVEISIKDLLILHNWELPTYPRREPVLLKSATTLLSIRNDPTTAHKWMQWLDHELEPKAKKSSAPTKAELQKLELTWPEVPNLMDTMRKELGQVNAGMLKLTMWPLQEKEKEKHFYQWLRGTWLESVVLSTLQNSSETLHLNECCMNLIPHIPGQRGEGTSFEFDVVAMRGYQLFAFSCTTEDGGRALLKQKLFEVCIRARQMGGDEACAALVCCMEQKRADKLEWEVRREMNMEGRIRVFGVDHLATLSTSLENWIRQQSSEEE
ncbi:MAG TPA: hypothetical protein VFV38_43800 [Ktedonobacteraceae bacterium]|nr:hypothetical protein [Ktedonobacteraceae bacterium]